MPLEQMIYMEPSTGFLNGRGGMPRRNGFSGLPRVEKAMSTTPRIRLIQGKVPRTLRSDKLSGPSSRGRGRLLGKAVYQRRAPGTVGAGLVGKLKWPIEHQQLEPLST